MTYAKSKPGSNLRDGDCRGPGVRRKLCSLLRIMTNALTFNTGRDRSNALRGTIFTEPASAEPCDSGVGVYSTSIRATLFTENMSIATVLVVLTFPTPELAILKPSSVIGTFSAGAPLIDTSRELPPTTSMEIPGRNLRKSAALPSGTYPNSSVETTFLILGAKR